MDNLLYDQYIINSALHLRLQWCWILYKLQSWTCGDFFFFGTGNKVNNIDVVYTPWYNLKKTPSMDVGQVGFHNSKMVRAHHLFYLLFLQQDYVHTVFLCRDKTYTILNYLILIPTILFLRYTYDRVPCCKAIFFYLHTWPKRCPYSNCMCNQRFRNKTKKSLWPIGKSYFF